MQPHAEAHPSDPVEQKVDAEQGPQDINAVERPVSDNDQTEDDCHCGGEKDESPRLVGRKLGCGLLAAGVVRVYLAMQLPAGQPRGLVFLAAAVTILLGLIIVSHWPLDSVYVLGTLLGVDLLFHGVGWVSFGMGLHSHA